MLARLADAWAPWLIDAGLKSLLLGAVAWGVLSLLRVRDANQRHRVWTVVLAGMLAMPALVKWTPAIPVPAWSFVGRNVASDTSLPTVASKAALPSGRVLGMNSQNAMASSASSDLPVAFAPSSARRVLPSGVTPRPNVSPPLANAAQRDRSSSIDWAGKFALADWQTGWVVVYACVSGLLFALLGVGLVLTRRLVRDAKRVNTAALPAIGALRANVLASTRVETPAAVGVLRPVVVLPQDWQSWPEETLRHVLAHEAAHIDRRDPLTTLLAEVNVALWWFHPLSWLLRRSLSSTAEQACDDAVLAGAADRAAYAESLLAMAARLTTRSAAWRPTSVAMARRPQVETRIDAILDETRPLARPLGRRAGALFAAIALPLIAVIAALQPISAAPADETPPASQASADDPEATVQRRVAGQVVEDATGKPVADVDVRLSGWTDNRNRYDAKRARTDRDGHFEFVGDQVPEGKLQIIAFHENSASRTEMYRGTAIDLGNEKIELRLKSAPSLRVRVVDRQSQQPLADAMVRLTWTDGDRDHRVDAKGETLIRGLTPALWTIEVFAPGHAEGGQAIHLVGAETTEVTVELDPGYHLAGTVIDTAGNPIADVGISVFPDHHSGGQIEYLKTGANGDFSFPYLQLATVELTLSKEGIERRDMSVTPTVAAGQTQRLDLTLDQKPDGGSIVGTVVDSSNRPVAGAKVFNRGRSSHELRETTTDASGQFRLDNVYRGSLGYDVFVAAVGYAPGIANFSPGTRDAPALVAISLVECQRIKGRVVDEAGKPVQRAYVSVEDSSRYGMYTSVETGLVTTTDGDGKFAFDSVPAAAKFEVRKDGFSNLEEFDIKSIDNEEAVVVLKPEGVVIGKVVDATTGKPITDFTAKVGFSPDRTAADPGHSLTGPRATGDGEVFVSADGAFRMGDFPQGMPVQISIDAQGYRRGVLRRVVARAEAAAKNEPSEFRLEPIAKGELVTFAGKLVDAQGAGVTGVSLRLIVAERRAFPRAQFPFNWQMIRSGQAGENATVKQFLSATTDTNGRFRFTDVQTGPDVELVWWGPGVSQDRRAGLDKLTGDEREQLQIEIVASGSVTGAIDRQRFPQIDTLSLSGNHDSFQAQVNSARDGYEVRDVPPGSYELQLYRYGAQDNDAGYSTEVIHRKKVEVKSGETVVLDLGPDPPRKPKPAAAAPPSPQAPPAVEAEVDDNAKELTPDDANTDVVIEGVVVDEQQRGIVGARLVVPFRTREELWHAEAVSGTDGKFTLTLPAERIASISYPTMWVAWCYHPDHSLAATSIYKQVEKRSKEPLKFSLKGPSDTGFDVTDPTGKPVVGAVVEPRYFYVGSFDAIPKPLQAAMAANTDSRGRALLPTIGREGFLQVQVTAPGYGRQVLELVPSDAEPAIRSIQLRAVGRLEGQLVVDDPALKSNIKLYFDQDDFRGESTFGDAEVVTDEEGRFVVPEIAEGSINLFVFHNNDAKLLPKIPKKIEVYAGSTTELSVPFTPAVRARGRIRTEPEGGPVAGGYVALHFGGYHQGSRAFTDDKGNFAASVLPGSVRQQLIMQPPGSEGDWEEPSDNWQKIIAVPEGVAEFELPPIKLVETESVRGTLVDQDGTAVAGIEVTAVSNNRRYFSRGETNAAGEFELKLPHGLQVESYGAFIRGANGDNYDATVTIETPLQLQIER